MSKTGSLSASKTLVYYLGNKQRMAGCVADAVDEVAVGSAPVLDLFCGVGSASLALGRRRPVYAVDVQEYARVMCSALLSNPGVKDEDLLFFRKRYAEYSNTLEDVYAPVIAYEQSAFDSFEAGDHTPLSNIVEHGCMLEQYRYGRPAEIDRAITDSYANLRTHGVAGYDAIVRYYGGTYFSYEQAVRLSAARRAVDDMPVALRDVALAAVLSSASHCARTVGGQFAQPLRTVGPSGDTKRGSLQKVMRLSNADTWMQIEAAFGALREVPALHGRNQALRYECLTYLDTQPCDSFAAIYADPPYSRYHYSRYYHVLETIALGDEPVVTVNPATGLPSRGVYRSGRYQSPFSTRGGAAQAFDDLFAKASVRAPALVLSYSPYPESKKSTPRMVTIAQLKDMANKYYGSVESRYVSWVSHSKLNTAKLELASSKESEVLIVCRR